MTGHSDSNILHKMLILCGFRWILRFSKEPFNRRVRPNSKVLWICLLYQFLGWKNPIHKDYRNDMSIMFLVIEWYLDNVKSISLCALHSKTYGTSFISCLHFQIIYMFITTLKLYILSILSLSIGQELILISVKRKFNYFNSECLKCYILIAVLTR